MDQTNDELGPKIFKFSLNLSIKVIYFLYFFLLRFQFTFIQWRFTIKEYMAKIFFE